MLYVIPDNDYRLNSEKIKRYDIELDGRKFLTMNTNSPYGKEILSMYRPYNILEIDAKSLHHSEGEIVSGIIITPDNNKYHFESTIDQIIKHIKHEHAVYKSTRKTFLSKVTGCK